MARVSTAELTEALTDTLHKFNGRISNAEAIGALSIVHATLMESILQESEKEESNE